LDAAIADRLAGIIALARSHLDEVRILEQDHTPERSLLRLSARYRRYRVFITEIISRQARKYHYYALDGEVVVAGFDNAADPRALRLKYGHIDQEHAGELVPHLHLEDKAGIELTGEIECAGFIVWLQTNLPAPRTANNISPE
jgi:hypothetical protein